MIVVTVSRKFWLGLAREDSYVSPTFLFSVSRANLKQIVGEHAGDDYIDQLLSEADFFNDGKISYTEFLQAFSKRNEELVYNMYELERDDSRHSEQSDNSDDEVLRRFGLLKTLRKRFNSSANLSGFVNAEESTRARSGSTSTHSHKSKTSDTAKAAEKPSSIGHIRSASDAGSDTGSLSSDHNSSVKASAAVANNKKSKPKGLRARANTGGSAKQEKPSRENPEGAREKSR